MVFVDRAPIRSGWTHVWTRVAVITYFVASTASVLPNGSTDFPLVHFFEAIASATGSVMPHPERLGRGFPLVSGLLQ